MTNTFEILGYLLAAALLLLAGAGVLLLFCAFVIPFFVSMFGSFFSFIKKCSVRMRERKNDAATATDPAPDETAATDTDRPGPPLADRAAKAPDAGRAADAVGARKKRASELYDPKRQADELLERIGQDRTSKPPQQLARELFILSRNNGKTVDVATDEIPMHIKESWTDVTDRDGVAYEIEVCRIPGKDTGIALVQEREEVRYENGLPPLSPMAMEAEYGPYWDMGPVWHTREHFYLIRDKSWLRSLFPVS